MPPGFSGNLIFAIIARMLCGNHLNYEVISKMSFIKISQLGVPLDFSLIDS